MAKNRNKKKRAASDPVTDNETSSAPKQVVDINEVNLRTAGPVTRLRGIMAVVSEKVGTVEEKLAKWGEENTQASEIAQAVTSVVSDILGIMEQLEALELAGFSPERKSFTAKTKEGDHVSVLEKYRDHYEDLIDRSLMNDLTVFRKNDNRGGLILETTSGQRMKTAASHVVRLSQPKSA